MRIVTWLLRAFIFFALFAFALNNQHSVSVHWFFGARWQAPMVIIVLLAFAAGAAVGVSAMMPAWWRQRRSKAASATEASLASPATTAPAASASGGLPSDGLPSQPPREAL